MLLFKKIVAPFFFPMTFLLTMALVGIVLLWFTRKQKTGKMLVSFGVIILCILSYKHPADWLLKPLERAHPNFTQAEEPIEFVVVLGGGHTRDPEVPLTSYLNDPSTRRLVEGIRLHRMHPGSKLVFSGVGVSQTMAEVAMALGVDSGNIIITNKSRDTKDEAVHVKSVVRADPFILVTSASHMPRAMALFRKKDMHPIPSPTRHLVVAPVLIQPWVFFPHSYDLYKSERAVYEYLGLAWAWLRGQV